jgi:zinc and cadmium transporter
MASWIWCVAAGLVASTAALVGSAAILLAGERAERAAIWLLSFAVGTLLGAGTLGLLPEALEHVSIDRAMPLFLAGMVLFISIERVLRWRHPHQPHPGHPGHPPVERATAAMLLWGDAVHNFIDGLVLGVSFGVGVEVGIAASIAILAHEVPQEIGDFAVLVGSGMPRKRAVALNYLSGLTVVPGALVSFAWSSASHAMIGWLLPLAAGGFVYIALADLVPALHHRRGTGAGFAQVLLVLLGVGAIWAVSRLHH